MLAYCDCFSGISGDMLLGAFIDSGIPADELQRDLTGLSIESFALDVSHVERHGIRAVRCDVRVAQASQARHWKDIQTLIGNSALSDMVKDRSLAVFQKLAEAEAGIHGCSLEDVHFHEVGAVDAIIDIVGCVLCMERLGITRLAVSPLPQGRGFVDCRHGRLPLPAPATLSLLEGLPVYGVDLEGELVTPTGAAIVAALGSAFGPLPPMTISTVGYGAGQRDIATHPNLLRMVIGAAHPVNDPDEKGYLTDTVHTLETTIDDMNPEFFGYLMEMLFSNGALDVIWIPVHGKKSRPGTLVQVLCRTDQLQTLRDILFKETTTLGVRVSTVQRWLLPRETVRLELSVGMVDLKRVVLPSGEIRWIPEYETCRRVAREMGLPIHHVYEQIAREAVSAGN